MPHITIDIDFDWYPWMAFRDIAAFQRHPARGPLPPRSGVYEIRQVDAEEILFIGSSAKLTRLYDMLFRSSTRDSSLSVSLREDVENDSSRFAIRWAEIAEWYRLAGEYQLLQHYVQRFGRLPKYVRH